jgi:hypothetical protein
MFVTPSIGCSENIEAVHESVTTHESFNLKVVNPVA